MESDIIAVQFDDKQVILKSEQIQNYLNGE